MKKPTNNLGVLVVTAAVAGVAGYTAATVSGLASVGRRPAPPLQPAPPAPEIVLAGVDGFSPQRVVEEQMKAMVACRSTPGAAARVFAFASPANRAVTGPLDRFERMLWRPPFDALIVNQGWSAGRAVEQEGAAAVLVLTVGPRGDVAAFRFYLSRQTGEGRGRWMTDAVIPLEGSSAREPVARVAISGGGPC